MRPKPSRPHAGALLAVLSFALRAAEAAPAIQVVRPADKSRFLVGQPVLLVGAPKDNKDLRSFGFEIDKKVIAERTAPPYGAVWDTAGSKPGKHDISFRVRQGRRVFRSRAVTVELLKPPPDLDAGELALRQRQRWAFGAALFKTANTSETGEWLAMAFTQALTAAAIQLPHLPVVSPQSARALVESDPVWLRRPPSKGMAVPLTDETRDACLVTGRVEVADGKEGTNLPVAVEAKVWWGKAGAYVCAHRVEGKLNRVLTMQAELISAVLSTMEFYLTEDERESLRSPFKGRFDTYRAVNLGHVAARRGDLSQALKHYQAAAKREPKNPAVWLALAQGRIEQQQYVKAVEASEKALKLAAKDPLSSRLARQYRFAAAKLGCDHYGFRRPTDSLRCAKIVVEADPADLVSLGRWMQLVRVLEPEPENFERAVQLGEAVLADEKELPKRGLKRVVLKGVITAHLALDHEKEASEWFARIDGELELAEALALKFEVYRRTPGHEKGCYDAGSNYLAFAPAEEAPEVVRHMVPAVQVLKGDEAARTFLEQRGAEVWKKVEAEGSPGARVKAAGNLARAWDDLEDKAKRGEWAAKALELAKENSLDTLPGKVALFHLFGIEGGNDAVRAAAVELLQSFPNCSDTQSDLMEVFLKLKDLPSAQQAAKNILKQSPDDPKALKCASLGRSAKPAKP